MELSPEPTPAPYTAVEPKCSLDDLPTQNQEVARTTYGALNRIPMATFVPVQPGFFALSWNVVKFTRQKLASAATEKGLEVSIRCLRQETLEMAEFEKDTQSAT
jgi:hypothetical protein